MKSLNLGCGSNFFNDWTNIDFTSYSPNVIQHDLRKGIPFENNNFDFVYHSHVLEHFNQFEGNKFIKECYRVLKPNGIIRVVVPDLQKIIVEYLRILNTSIENPDTNYQYDWIKLELLDQLVRNEPGGATVDFIRKLPQNQQAYVKNRIGDEFLGIQSIKKPDNKTPILSNKSLRYRFSYWRNIKFPKIKYNLLLQTFSRLLNDKNFKEHYETGKFRKGGEVHLWMYDKYSLTKLLKESGFNNVKEFSAHESHFKDWHKYNLDINVNNKLRKPDSLIVEAIK